MNTPRKVQMVFNELRESLADKASDEELLELASILVVQPDMVRTPNTVMHGGASPFTERPLHEVMEQYPWRLVSQEWSQPDDFLIEEPVEVLLDQYIAQAA